MWTPDWLYRLLPYVYATSGLCCLVFIGTDGVEIASAALLFTAAALTVYWRFRDRASPTKQRRPYRQVPPRKF